MADFEDSLVADLGERGRRAGGAARRRPRHARVHLAGGQGLSPRRAAGDAPRAPARLAPPGAPRQGRRPADLRVAVRLRAVRLPQRSRAPRAAAAGCTSTSRSSSPTARRASGTTCSSRRRRRSGIPRGSVRATVLIETIHAAFEMEEILYELREHSAGLNAGRWDYLFSCIKTFRGPSAPVLPDRAQVTMTVPFLRAYTERLVLTCHRRGAHAMGGMAAFIPSRRDAGGQRAGDGEGPRRQAARIGRRLRRHLGRPPGPRRRSRPRSSMGSWARGRTSADAGSTRRPSAPRCRAIPRHCSTCASTAAG